MNKVIAVAGVATVLFAAVVLLEGTYHRLSIVRYAKNHLEGVLPDPDGIRYRNIVTRAHGVVCGEYNAKGRAGGYEGFNQFIYRRGQSIQRIRAGTEDQMAGHWEPWCEGGPDEIVAAATAEFNFEFAVLRGGCLMWKGSKTSNEACAEGPELVRRFRQDFPSVPSPDFKIN